VKGLQRVLGVESTAHTFSVSVVTSDGDILSNERSVYRAPEGSGIHPAEAAKHHFASAGDVLRRAFDVAGVRPDQIDAVSYSMGPGLGPCLRVGGVVARSLAVSLSVPLVPVNHAVGHVELGCLVTRVKDPVVLLVSGGHTMVLAFARPRWRILGESLDLTLGQLFDQFGRSCGLASPCGPQIEEAASKSDEYIGLPYSVKGNDVSYSGLLTAAKRAREAGGSFEEVSFSLQETAFAMIAEATDRVLAFTGKSELIVVGGVAANRRLSQMLTEMASRHSAAFFAVPLALSGDCGAQIAWTGCLAFRSGLTVPVDEGGVKQSWRLDTVDAPWRS
jgi:N6-L-threonylcarbamoyladenine synthase